MKRVLNIILCLSIFCPATLANMCFAGDLELAKAEKEIEILSADDKIIESNSDVKLPSIFIWKLPDDDVSDYVEAEDDSEDFADEYEDDIYYTKTESAQLKGYLEYVDDSNAITLKNTNKELVLNLAVPQDFKTKNLPVTDKKIPPTTFARNVYSRTDKLQYNIAPIDTKTEVKGRGFSLGTAYNESIDTSDLGFTTSFYTKYENKYFSLKTSYDKESGVDYSQNIDKFSITPELKLNKYISIKDVITSDVTRNRTKNELVLSIKPTKDDRVRFEFGTNYTFDENNAVVRSQVKFSTHFKL